MKFPYTMLLDFVETELTAEQAGDLLTMAGFELEDIEHDVLDIKVMSNRGDGLSMLGLAREVLAKDQNARPTALYKGAAGRFLNASKPIAPCPASVTIETEDCTRYACRLFEIDPNQTTPDWIATRLRQAGQRTISLLVDLTNYVMLELGQPLHAFDYDTLTGGQIVVRSARYRETLTTLDGNDHELKPGQIMICDAERPVAAAGIMGGKFTEVTDSTTRILLESAHFKSGSVRRTRKQLGLSTEASYRFERSVDPDGVVAAIERFTELLGLPGSEIVDVYPGESGREPVALRVDRAELLLGMKIGSEASQRYLERLGMEVAGHGDPFYVIPPSWRPDIVREEDLVEELGRVHGYDRIPEELPVGRSTSGGAHGQILEVDEIISRALSLGYSQTISHSLGDRHPLDRAEPLIGPRNPSSPDMAYLRNSVLPNLAQAAQRNGGRDLHLFELGSVFSSDFCERRCLGILSTGQLLPSDTKGEQVPHADFFSLKGDILALCDHVGRRASAQTPSRIDARFHPTRQAELLLGQEAVGIFGQIHPDVASEARLPAETYLAELWVDALLAQPPEPLVLQSLSRNPSVRRDISLLIDKTAPYADIEKAIAKAAGDVLERQWLFDVFAGQGIPAGKHSLGIALLLRKHGENFTDEEANRVRETVVGELALLGGATR